MAYPLVATLAGTVKYNDGVTLFDGWVLLLMAYPTGYTYATVANQLYPQRVADRLLVRIQQGVYDQSVRVYYTTSLDPPNCKYVGYFYDSNNASLGNTGLFSVTSSPITLSVPSMTVPVAPVSVPTP